MAKQFIHSTIPVNGTGIFYREAGDPHNLAFLLLHGFPSSSVMFKNLMTALSDNYYLIAPYYPGFGFSAFPEVFDYTFKGISACMNAFTDAISLKCYGNAYDEGNGPNWDETIEYWKKTHSSVKQVR